MTESQSIEKVVRTFVQGLQEGNPELLQQLFTADAELHFYQGGRCQTRTPADFLASLSPQAAPEVATVTLQGLEHAGDVGHAYLRHAQGGVALTEYLCLSREGAQWKIASRSWHAEPAGAATAPDRQAA